MFDYSAECVENMVGSLKKKILTHTHAQRTQKTLNSYVFWAWRWKLMLPSLALSSSCCSFEPALTPASMVKHIPNSKYQGEFSKFGLLWQIHQKQFS